MSTSDFHRWRVEMLADVLDMKRELIELLRERDERDARLAPLAALGDAGLCEFTAPDDDPRIAELRARLDVLGRVNWAWRRLEPIDDDGRRGP